VPYIFRLDTTRKRERLPEEGRSALLQELEKGNLRQGWEARGCASWIEEEIRFLERRDGKFIDPAPRVSRYFGRDLPVRPRVIPSPSYSRVIRILIKLVVFKAIPTIRMGHLRQRGSR
jgi:hypothetical protein